MSISKSFIECKAQFFIFDQLAIATIPWNLTLLRLPKLFIFVMIPRDASDDVGTMKKRPVRYATIDGAYTVYRVRLGAVDGTPQVLYRYTRLKILAEFLCRSSKSIIFFMGQ